MAQATGGIIGSGGLGLSGTGGGMMALKRVASVVLDDSHEYFSGFQSLGTIYYTDPYSPFNLSGGGQKLNPNNSARPITPNQQFYPLIGELVFLVSTMSNEPSGGDKQFNPRNYYFPPIRVHNQSSQNSQPSTFSIEDATQTEKRDRAQSGTPNKSSKPSEVIFNLGDFFVDRGVKRLLPYEGDYIIEGRFGNSIRFGATTPYDKETEKPYPNPWSFNSVGGKSTPDETEAQVGDPITIIRNGQTEVVSDNALVPLLEDINGDHSSIYLCSNQRLENFKVAGASTASPDNVKLDAYLQEKEDEATKIAEDNAMTTAMYTGIGAGIGSVLGPPGTIVLGAVGYIAGEASAEDIPTPPTITVSAITSSQDDDTDDGLSFYNEMIGSGAVGEGNFIEEIVEFENVSVSGTEASRETIGENEAASNAADGGGSGNGKTGKKSPIPNPPQYPAKIPCLHNDTYFVNVNHPQHYSKIAKNIKNQTIEPDLPLGQTRYQKSSRVKYLVIHTSAGNYGQTHLDVCYLFMQNKPWTRVGYSTTIDKEGKCCRLHGDDYYTNGVLEGFGSGINNKNSVNIAWLGGASTADMTEGGDAMTREQAAALKKIITAYCDIYPDLKVIGHNQVTTKACPRFYVPEYMNQIGGKYAKNGYEFDSQNKGGMGSQYMKNSEAIAKITGLQSGV